MKMCTKKERCKGRYGQKRSILNEDVYKNGAL